MPDHLSSGYKVPYDLRPSKQAERYIMVDILRCLQRMGLAIEDYHYVGFGSYFFHDYRILHYELNVQEMTSIEGDGSLLTRCEFNKPYSSVEIIPKMSSDFLPSISRERNYLVWLDNDFGLAKVVTDDIATCFSRLCVGSIFFLTIDMELPQPLANASPTDIFDHFRAELQGEVVQGFQIEDFTASRRDKTTRNIISRAVQIGLRGRENIVFQNLLSLYYKDSNRMYTMGGVVCDLPLAERLSQGSVMQHDFVIDNFQTKFIEMPRIILTKKERLFLEPFCLGAERYDSSSGVPQNLFEIYTIYPHSRRYFEGLYF